MATQKLKPVNDKRYSFDSKNDVVRSFFGAELVESPEDDEGFSLHADVAPSIQTRAAAFLDSNRAAFRLDSVSLTEAEVSVGNAIMSVRYGQQHNGIPVYGTELIIGFRSRDNRIISTINNLDYGIPAELGRDLVKINTADALQAVEGFLRNKITRLEVPEQPQLFVYRHTKKKGPPPRRNQEPWEKFATGGTAVEGEVYLAWKVILQLKKPSGDWEVLVNAINGSILAAFDRRKYFQVVKANVFMPDPITTSGDANLYWGSHDDSLTAQLKDVVLEDLHPPGDDGERQLSGPWVRCVDRELPEFPPPKFHGDFIFSLRQREFLFGMSYYWINKLVKYLRGLGIQKLNEAITTPLEVDAVGFEDYGNSHFVDNSGTPFISFGKGSVPEASDAHVIVHEYGHALHHFLGIDLGCYEEGFCDFLAVAWLDPLNKNGFQRELVFPWVDNQWDGTPDDRKVNVTEKFSDERFNDYYSEYLKGNIFATALWDFFKTIGGDDANPDKRAAAADTVIRLYLDTLILWGGKPDPNMLAMGLMETDRTIHGGDGKYRIHIWRAFEDRGLWTGAPPPTNPPI